MYGDEAPRLGHYWDELSYGAVSLAGSDAAGPFVLPHTAEHYGLPDVIDLDKLADDCTSLANPDIDFAAFQGINLMLNLTESVLPIAFGGFWSPYSNLDGVNQFPTTWLPTWAWGDISVTSHEMGHSFGLDHSSGPYGYTYDNPWDVMSADRYPCYVHGQRDAIYGCIAQHTIGIHKAQLGWIRDEEIYTAGIGDHLIEIDSMTAPDSHRPRLIEIPVPGLETLTYTVEARQTAGYDVGTPGSGIVIHEYRYDSVLVPMVVDSDGNGDTTDDGTLWSVGEVFHIAEFGITVTVVQKTANGWVVDIQVVEPPVFTTCEAQNWVTTDECKALVALYEQTNGPKWRLNNGWLTLRNPCRWYGVYCEPLDDSESPTHTVIGIILGGNNLYGSIPARLGDLRSLRGINLTTNHLSGRLPKELGRLAHLEHLILGDNRLTGGIPPELGQLTELRSIELWTDSWQNGLSGPIPAELSGLNQLEWIDLAGQKLSGPVPEFFGRLSNLSLLRLSNNQLSGMLPSSLGDLTKLNVLWIDNNSLSGGIPHAFTSLENLHHFEFAQTGLCQPPDAVFQTWLHSLSSLVPNDVLCDTSMAGNYSDGAPGSIFAVRGVVFPPNVSTIVAVNGRPIGQVQTDEHGEVFFLLNTKGAGEGRYNISVVAREQAVFTIRLNDAQPLRPMLGPEQGPTLAIPSGTMSLSEVFAPFVLRP
jgi:hypothetical protein